jgi:hypothetical protein
MKTYEYYNDPAYYDMWAVREVGDSNFNNVVHVATEEKAKDLVKLLSGDHTPIMEKKWCMCTKLEGVARDCFSTCSICSGKDAYGGSSERPDKYKKTITSGDV